MTGQVVRVVHVLLPLPLDQGFDYALPGTLRVEIGCRVVVPWGKKKWLTGIVISTEDTQESTHHLKLVTEVIDTTPLFSQSHIELMQWMAQYYMTPLGLVLKSALPSALCVSHQTRILLNELTDSSTIPLTDDEILVIDALGTREYLWLAEVQKVVGKKDIRATLSSLEKKEIIVYQEVLKEKFIEKKEEWIRISPTINEGNIEDVITTLNRAPKQKTLFITIYTASLRTRAGILRSKALIEAKASSSHLKALVDRGYIEIHEDPPPENNRMVVDNGRPISILKNPLPTPNQEQQKVLGEIENSFEKYKTTLLYGPTASGKSIVYFHLISRYLTQGMQVLYIMPEIGLTEHFIVLFRRYFGENVLLYHSRISDRERVRIWRLLQTDTSTPYIIIGVRSAIFLPTRNLGLIVMDEEHERSFKQMDPVPRYHARDVAVMYAHKAGNTRVLLGSATPSFESLYNVKKEKYGFVRLTQKYHPSPSPNVQIIDISSESTEEMKYSFFSASFIKTINECLERGQQAIIFQNRRGYAPIVRCATCGYTYYCEECDIPLTYHKNSFVLHCHYCQTEMPMPRVCRSCGAKSLQAIGMGTEKLELYCKTLFPDAKVARLDSDNARRGNTFFEIVDAFEKKQIDILTGTNMIIKGLNFSNVGVAAMVNVDAMLYYPDFRTQEQAAQTLVQLAGRAGRHTHQAHIVVQTTHPTHPVLRVIQGTDYLSFYQQFISHRKTFGYPPIVRMIHLTLRSASKELVYETSFFLKKIIDQTEQDYEILGPSWHHTMRLGGRYIRTLVLKARPATIGQMKRSLAQAIDECMKHPAYKKVKISIDVDP